MKQLMFYLLLGFMSPLLVASEKHAMTLTSSAFTAASPLPVAFTCDGRDFSPPLTWHSEVVGTKSFAIIMADPDAPGGKFYHWVLINIPADVTDFPAGVSDFPSGVVTGKNSWGRAQYDGPCPPQGSNHHYSIHLYALDRMLDVPADADTTVVLAAMKRHILHQVELKTSYQRP